MSPFKDFRLWIIGLGTLVVPLDSSVNVAFPPIADHFGVAPADLRLVVVTFILTNISLLLIFGRMGDLWGYRRMFRLGLAVSGVALLFDAVAPSYGALLAARIGQGVGGALIVSCAPALVIGLYPDSARGPAVGAFAMIFALGTAIGPMVGGILLAEWGWSAVFWFRVPIAFTALILSLWLPPPQRSLQTARFDIVGAVWLGLSIATVFAAANLAPTHPVWAIAIAIVSAVSIWRYIHQQLHSTAPIIDLRIFRDLKFTALNVSSVLTNLAAFSIMLVVPFYLVRIGEFDVAAAGLLIAAYPIGIAIAAAISGQILRGATTEGAHDHTLRVVGMSFIGLGLWGIVSWADAPAIWLVAVTIGLTGIGLGLFQTSFLYSVTGKLPQDARGVAGSLAEMTRSMGNLAAATFLFELFRSQAATDGFLSGFTSTYIVAAFIPVIMLSVVIIYHLKSTRN